MCQRRKLIVIPGVWRKSMWRFYGCVFCLCAFLIDGWYRLNNKKMETSVTLKENLTWSNWRFVRKIFGNKYDFLQESPSPWSFFWTSAISFGRKIHPIHGSRYVTVMSLGTALRSGGWKYIFYSKLIVGIPVDVNKNKPKKSSPDPPPQKEQNNIWSKK